MGDAAYPYATHLDIKFDPLKLIDVSSLAKAVTDQWYNQMLCKVNDSVVRLCHSACNIDPLSRGIGVQN